MTNQFSELTKDFSPERRERIENKKNDLRQNLQSRMKLYNKKQKTSIRSDVKEDSLCIKLFDFGNFDLLNFQKYAYEGINGLSYYLIRSNLQFFNYKYFTLFSCYWDEDSSDGFQLALFAMTASVLLTLQLNVFDRSFCFSFCQYEALRYEERELL